MARWSVLCLLFACQQALPEARFDRPEVIGTRRTVTVERLEDPEPVRFVPDYCEAPATGDPTDRISPRRGETLRMEWLTAAPGAVAPTSWSFVVCEPDGLACAGPPLLVVRQPNPSNAPIVFDVAVPLGFSGNRLTVLGAVCFGGAAVSELGDETYDGCLDEGDGSLLVATIDIDEPESDSQNTQPVIESVLLNGQALSEEVLISGGPCSSTLPVVHVGERAELEVWLSDCSIDYRFDQLNNVVFETPFAYLYPSEGVLPPAQRLRPTEPEPSFDPEPFWYRAAWDLEITPSDVVPSEGRVLSVAVVVNDLYGGDDVRRVGYCLMP